MTVTNRQWQPSRLQWLWAAAPGDPDNRARFLPIQAQRQVSMSQTVTAAGRRPPWPRQRVSDSHSFRVQRLADRTPATPRPPRSQSQPLRRDGCRGLAGQ